MNAAAEPTVELVARLVRQQFPHWSDLEVRAVSNQGWDNRTFRLGDRLSVRLPSADGYVAQVGREQRWLPRLGPLLSTPIPSPVAHGAPTLEFPRPWSVYRWLQGVALDEAEDVDLGVIAADVAAFLRAFEELPVPPEAPRPGSSNGFRGGPLDRYLSEADAAVRALDGALRQQARAWLREATETGWSSAPVWVHGDVGPGNLLTRDGRLSAVIDFGCLAVGDPACDLTIAWTLFDASSRAVLRRHVGHDLDTWRRARGWAVWKAAITLRSEPAGSAKQRVAERTVRELWSDSE